MASRGRNQFTDKEARFIAEYLVDMNQTRAAQAAGYKKPEAAGYQLMKKPLIAKVIGQRKARQIERLELNADVVLAELYYMATRTADDFRDSETGEWTTDLDRISERAKHCVDGFEVEERTYTDRDGGETRTVRTKVKLVPKAVSVDMAMKHLGQYVKDNAQRGIDLKLLIPFDKLLEDRSSAPDEVEARIIDVRPVESGAIESPLSTYVSTYEDPVGNGNGKPKYGLKELLEEGEGPTDE